MSRKGIECSTVGQKQRLGDVEIQGRAEGEGEGFV